MNALQYPFEPEETRRPAPRPQRRRRRLPHRAIAAETVAKIAVNGLLSTAAIASLVNLLPYTLSQQAKLQEIRTEVKQTELQVNQLRNNFSRNFDPTQAKLVMQEQSTRIDPSQRRIIWLEKQPTQENYSSQN
ncbi:MAG: hypothetical protein ACOC0N_09390 [Chroococcales cyanobacterium]